MITLSQPSLKMLVILVSSTIILVYLSQKTRRFERAILATLWVSYMLIMLAMTLPPTSTEMLHLSFMERLAYQKPWNLQPFSLIPQQFKNMLNGQMGAARQFLGNIIMFIPAGFFPPMLFPKMRKWYGSFLPGFLWSLFIEVSQLILNLSGFCDRSFDTDDLILNTVGAMIGFLVYKVIFVEKHRPKKTRKKKTKAKT